MKEFSYTVQDALGIHARPAGQLAKQAKQFASKIAVTCGSKTADATRVMALMTLGVHQSQTVQVKTRQCGGGLGSAPVLVGGIWL